MADKFINDVGLQTIKQWIEGKFALGADLDTLEAEVQEIISEGGEPNVIETVKVNGTALTPDAQKAVDVTVPTKTSDLTNDDNVVKDANYVHTDNNYTTTEKEKLAAVEAGAEANVIETVKVNGTALTPDTNKAVNVEAAQLSDIARGGVSIEQGQSFISFSPDAQDGSVLSVQNSQGELAALATTDYVANNGGKIQKVKYDGTELTIDASDKSVNIPKEVFVVTPNETTYQELDEALTARKAIVIYDMSNGVAPWYRSPLFIYKRGTTYPIEMIVHYNNSGNKLSRYQVANDDTWTIIEQAITMALASQIPTVVSQLTNDSGYQTASDVQSAINTAVASAYKYKGSVATVEDLPASGNTAGDVWDVQETGVNYAWTGTAWDALGSYVDTSVLWTSTTGQTNTLEAMTVAEINAILEPSA